MRVTTLHAGNPGPMTGSGNWTYLVPGDAPVLIDAGVGVPAHVDAILDAASGGPAMVVVTHAHSDHIAGAPALHARAPQARFLKWPWPERDGRYAAPWSPLGDGQLIATGEGPLEVIHTPGHAPDHVALWHADSRTVFTGDLLVKGSTVVIPASAGGSLRAYLASLARVAALGPARALPAHGPAIDDPPALIASYVRHRQMRETQVLDALAAGDATPAAIAERLYPILEPALMPMAEESVLAHLWKLADEGRAVRDGDHWTAC